MPVDFVQAAPDGRIIGTGDVAQRLMQSNFNINALRTNDVLRKEEWSQLDNALIGIARKRLVAVETLVSEGLTYSIADGLGTTILEWELVSDMEPANVSMSGTTEGARDIMDFTLQSMPLPIIHKDFNINIRKLHASRRTGQPLDTAQAEMAARLVAEETEAMVFQGHATRVGTSQIFGLMNHTDRNTVTMTLDWDATTTGANFVTDVMAMISALHGDDMYGPYGMFVTNTTYNRMAADYIAGYPKTIISRLLEIPGLSWIKPSKDVTATEAVMFQLTSDVVDEVIGLQPTVVSWETQGGMTMNFKVMSIMIPRVRSTVTNQSGIAHVA